MLFLTWVLHPGGFLFLEQTAGPGTAFLILILNQKCQRCRQGMMTGRQSIGRGPETLQLASPAHLCLPLLPSIPTSVISCGRRKGVLTALETGSPNSGRWQGLFPLLVAVALLSQPRGSRLRLCLRIFSVRTIFSASLLQGHLSLNLGRVPRKSGMTSSCRNP